MLMQAYESQDPALALQFVNILAEATGIAGGSGAAAQPAAAPVPAPSPEEVPLGRYGMKVPVFSK
jgi:hypothetical protein